jgi:hypothetical protein
MVINIREGKGKCSRARSAYATCGGYFPPMEMSVMSNSLFDPRRVKVIIRALPMDTFVALSAGQTMGFGKRW